MKATGIVRKIDDLGRFVIPMEIRNTLNIKEGDPMEIFTRDNGEIVIKAFSTHCIFCDEIDNGKLKLYNDKLVCDKCISKLTSAVKVKSEK